MDKKQLRKLVAYLYAIANEEYQPLYTDVGLCSNAQSAMLMECCVYDFLDEVWQVIPLPYPRGDKWKGEKGEERRTLAGLTAAFIETEYLGMKP